MNLQHLLSQFQTHAVETCFHGRHLGPQILADLNGSNWSLQDYVARGGYQALRKILGQDGGEGLTQDQVIATVKEVGPARSRRCGLSYRLEVELHAPPIPGPKVLGV